MLIGRLKIEAQRWPWQKGYNWHGATSCSAPLNQPRPGEKASPRFGGGWKFKLGFAWSGRTVIIDMLYGMVVVTLFRRARCEECAERVGDYHAPGCSKRRNWVVETSWLNRVDGFGK